MNVIAITGCEQSRLGRLADLVICAPGIDTATAQELHMVTTHILCDIVEAQLASDYKKDGNVTNACAFIAGHEESK
jgi:D-sedoheptulose 7-phosphate isomerase